METSLKKTLVNMSPVLVTMVAVWFAWWMSLAPSPLPADAPEHMFSAERAHRHIALVCTEPQPVGSIRNDFACQYIQDELDGLGVETELVHYYERIGGSHVARYRAVLGRIRGTNPTRAFAVDAHFDSVPWGPGAADDWAGIAAMLETARALKAGAPLQNDVIFVFADQEEFNMGGAKAFRHHPWFEETGVMLGLETRGASGPSLMFETSPNNGFVVRELARSGAGARTNSVMYDFYKRMPFNSDFNHYKYHVAGLNLAFIDNFDYYHTSLDNPDNISLASLQHHGNYTLSLARHFGNMPLDDCYAPDASYLNTLGGHMVVYPMSWGWPLAVVAWLFMGVVLGYGVVRGALGWRGMLAGTVMTLGAGVLAAVPIGVVSLLLFLRFREAALYQNTVYAMAFLCFGLAVFVMAVNWVRRCANPRELLASQLPLWAMGLLFFQTQAPGGANLALVPLFFGSVALLALLLLFNAGKPESRTLVWCVALTVPAVMFLAPLLYMAFYAITVMGSAIVVPLAILTAALVLPQLTLNSVAFLNRLALVLLLGSVALLFAAYRGTLPSPSSPQMNCLAYGVDYDTEEAWWLSSSRHIDEWLSLYIPEETSRQLAGRFLPDMRNAYLKTPAPMPVAGPAVVEVMSDRIENDRRILECRLNSLRDPQRLWLRVESGVRVYSAHALGHELEGAEQGWEGRFDLMPREGVELRLEVGVDLPLILSIREQVYGLPELPVPFTPRPAHIIAEPNRTLVRLPLGSDFTYAYSTVDLGVFSPETETL